MAETSDLLVVGAGHAGVHLATRLVQGGFDGSIRLLSDQTVYPYEKPPLSKSWLKAEVTLEQIQFRSAAYWERSSVDLRLGVRVTDVDPATRIVATESGDEYGYSRLVWAAGGRPRRLPAIGDHPNVHYLGDLADARALQASTAQRVVIIGGGFIGLEVAATLRQRGANVVVLESLPRLMARATGPLVAQHIESVHRAQGVEFKFEDAVVGAATDGDSRVTSVQLASGASLPADLVLIGIGQVPNEDILVRAGAHASNGLLVDTEFRTNLDGIFAIGDVARFPLDDRDDPLRLEAVQNAVAHSKALADLLLTQKRSPLGAPTFWSNQFDVAFKSAGLVADYDTEIVRGDVQSGAFSVLYVRDGVLVAIECVNRESDFGWGRRAIGTVADIDAREW